MKSDILPIGSVVILNNATRKIMITGYKVIDGNTSILYDYCGCMFPCGIISNKEMFIFNKIDIKKVYFIGFKDRSYAQMLDNFFD